MDYRVSMFLTVAAEVKSDFMLERFGDSSEGCDFMREYSEFMIVY